MALGRRLQLAAVVLFFVGYAVLSHYSNSNAQAQDLGAVLAFAPLLVIGVALVWRSSGILIAALAAAAAGLTLREFWPLFAQNFSLAVLIQQCGFYSILAFSFARTLTKGRVPLCTQFADKIHGPLSPLELRYTRGVTLAWVVFFLLNVAASILLFAFAPSRIWSLFVNFLSAPLVLLMFAAEYAVRRRVLPQVRRSGGLMATLRVYFAKSP
jgi:uncharacterized membrane protein